MKKWIAMMVVLAVGFTAANVQAGSARRHTIEGIMIGTGVAILGAAIISELNKEDEPAPAAHIPPAPQYTAHQYTAHHRPGKPWHKRGHWEVRRVWVEPVYETRWNPGHYTPDGRWVNGRMQEFLATKGYWREERVWVRR